MSKENYTVGTAVRITDSLEITDPDSVSITIKNPSGVVVVNSIPMILEALGKYYYVHQSAAADPTGEYTVITSVSRAGQTSVVRNTFTMNPQ